MTQTALAEAAGITRQTLGAIEGGRTDPSISVAASLARALDLGLDDLFSTPSLGGSVRAELASPVGASPDGCARVALTFIRDRWVAHPLLASQPEAMARAADGLLAPGAQRSAAAHVDLLRPPAEARSTVVLLGCAPALGLLADALNSRPGPGRFLWLQRSSTAALRALDQGHAHAGGVHLGDGIGGESNVPSVSRLLPRRGLLLVTLARWEAGLLMRAGNPLAIREAADLGRRSLRIAARERGAGARLMLDRSLKKAGVNPKEALSGAIEARGHLEVAQAVALGAADVGLAMRGAALAYGLAFVPLAEERFDLVISKGGADDPRIGRLLDTMSSAAFRRDIKGLGGYDAAECGQRVTEIRAA